MLTVLAVSACGGLTAVHSDNGKPTKLEPKAPTVAQLQPEQASKPPLTEAQIQRWDVLHQQGIGFAVNGKPKLAEKKFLQALEILDGRRDHRYAMTARELGTIASMKSNWQAARQYFQDDYDIQVADLGELDSAVILPLSRIALTEMHLKDIPAAKEKATRALQIQRKQSMPNLQNEALLLENLAKVHLEAGEADEALKVAKQAQQLWKLPEVVDGGADLLSISRTLGACYMATNNFKEAEKSFLEASRISDSYATYADQLQDRLDVARACEKQGATGKADKFFKDALARGEKALKECQTLPHAREHLAQTRNHLRYSYLLYADYLDRHGKAPLAQQMRSKASQELSKS